MAPCNQPGCGKIRCSSHFASIPKPTGAGSTSVRQCMHCSFAVHSLTDDHELNHVIAVEAIHQRIYLCTARNIPEVDFGSSISDTIDRLAALKQRLQNGRVSASSAFSQEECVLVNQFLRPATIAMHFEHYARLDEAPLSERRASVFSKWTYKVCHDHTKYGRRR